MQLSATFLSLGLAFGKPVIPRDDTSPTPTPTVPLSDQTDTCATSTVSAQWLSTCNTTVFWPTSTDYFYGPTTGPGASAVICNAQWVEYNGRADGLASLGATSTSTSYWITPTSAGACNTEVWPEGPGDPHTGPITTLCDGITRALGPREYLTSYWPGTGPCSTSTVTESDTTLLYRSPSPSPSCELNTQDCIPIWQTYSSRLASYYSSVTTEIPGDTNSPIRPTQCPSTSRNYTVQDPCTNCHYLPDTATLFYWPVMTTSGDLCLQNGSTVPATPTGNGPNTAVVDGHTFISPSIYVSFTSIYARSNQRAHPGGSCGGEYEDVIISVNPEAVTSYRNHINAKYPRIGTAYPFNFAEFQPHTLGNYTLPLIPWDQYRGGSQCIQGGSGCTMIRNDYLPWMEIPDVMTQIDPRWTECHRSWYIPPVSLVPLIGGQAAQPTGAAEASIARAGAASAVPQSGVAAPTPEATSNGR
ncbi:hypothetical protein CNMCM5793_007930 [Aspergillus hiratsukae]|uniref:Uncharacterized protein n=1 Tax=Aspergillus hiratsukae TaxID=1194566 RepID=A0A8H6P6U8_9EURO|nr:hypothetical protein CNMCM5793_007930 [Aspergillus hiratsukae]KAF7165750.1 hypothetical protein CNMCM6106_001826 [Aspergillus hiratsukae]